MINFEPRKWNAEQQIYATIAYFDIFDLALSAEEIAFLVLGNALDTQEIKLILEKITHQISMNAGLYALKNRENLFFLREEKRRKLNLLEKQINKFAKIYKYVPFVRGVAVCNYLKLGVVDQESDIDLLVITVPGRIFMARVFLTILMQILGIKRSGNKIAGKFCLSFYVNEENLDFQKILENPYDIYFIYWLKALWPIYGENKLWSDLRKVNMWMKKYLDWEILNENLSAKKNWFKILIEWGLSGFLGNFLESSFKNYFTRRHSKRSEFLPPNASVIVNSQMLKFHNNDRRSEFRRKFEEKLERFGFSN